MPFREGETTATATQDGSRASLGVLHLLVTALPLTDSKALCLIIRTDVKQKWDTALARADDLVQQMTLEEIANVTQGQSDTMGCSGLTGSVARLGFPGICLSDGPAGVRGTEFVNAYPAGIHAAASFNRKLAYERGLYMGGEFRNKGGE